jgi:hypothetical protein
LQVQHHVNHVLLEHMGTMHVRPVYIAPLVRLAWRVLQHQALVLPAVQGIIAPAPRFLPILLYLKEWKIIAPHWSSKQSALLVPGVQRRVAHHWTVVRNALLDILALEVVQLQVKLLPVRDAQ